MQGHPAVQARTHPEAGYPLLSTSSSTVQPEPKNQTCNSASMEKAPASGAQQLLGVTVSQCPGISGGLTAGGGYEKSHSGFRSSIIQGGSFPFLALKDIHVH